MITQEQLASLARQPVFSTDGVKIGDVVGVLLDDTTGKAEWARVRAVPPGPGEVFVPLREAVHAGDRVEVPFPVAAVEAAARVDVQGREVLSVADEERLSACFGLDGLREQMNAERGTGWSEMDRIAGIRSGTDGHEESRTRLRPLREDGA
ncbi:PRC-barrel domain-containing protein [Streptomyces sp. NPDC015131]|uniref:PRC-barrel domain-containing protein n=1 Tax=Streptomyces sp. NPDC015131 TaxID=3364941 RepID=UPI003702BF39